jgi:FAD/FMN-containing dehydrogenase
MYYCTKENILARYDSEKGWIQINKQPTAEEMKTLLGLGSLAYLSEVSEDNLAEALKEKVNAAAEGNHAHLNKAELDKIADGDVTKWAEAYAHSQADHAPVGAQANIIEAVKVNGEALTITDKAVDIIIPESTKVEASETNGNIKVDGEEVGACLLVTLVAGSEDELDMKMEKFAEAAEDFGCMDILVVDTPSLKKDVWAARSSFLTAIESDTKWLDEMDVVVPVDQIAEFLGFVREAGAAQGLKIRNFGHAGDGNLHIYCTSNTMEEEEFLAKNKIVMDQCYARCQEIGGQVSGEHGIGHAKKEYLRESVGETAMGLMSGIKAVFDPKGLLNPGKICTDL